MENQGNRRSLILFCLLLVSISFIQAQDSLRTKETPLRGRLSLSLYNGLGQNVFSGNLSSQGVYQRKHYRTGMVTGIQAVYNLDNLLLGTKLDTWGVSTEYKPEEGKSMLADDASLVYAACLLGARSELQGNFYLDYVVGCGYLHYDSKSISDGVESDKYTGMFGYNLDVLLAYRWNRHFSLGLGASYLGGKSSTLTEKTAGQKTKIKLDKWDTIKVKRVDVYLSLVLFI